MKPNQSVLPFINVRAQQNRTPTGRRTSTLARRAALYYAYGRDKAAQLEGRQRGEWMGPNGRIYTHEEVMAWVKTNALACRYTFQGILSIPEGELTAAEFGRAMYKGGQIEDWRLLAHDDTRHRHAHVLWFGDKRMDRQAFLSWQTEVRAELVRLEQQQQANDQTVQQEIALDAGRSRSQDQEVGLGW
ncbi:MAG: hypothetical protein KJ069_29095 [Anaerolineae bacterium]|nr:hypothetical protein [Anaerolineae bacterium]